MWSNHQTNQPTSKSYSCQRESTESLLGWGQGAHRVTMFAGLSSIQAGSSLQGWSGEGVDLEHVLTHRALFRVLHTNTHLQVHLTGNKSIQKSYNVSKKIVTGWLIQDNRKKTHAVKLMKMLTLLGLLSRTVWITWPAPWAGMTSPLGAFICSWTLWGKRSEKKGVTQAFILTRYCNINMFE